MTTIHVSPEFPLNRRMRKAVWRGKLQVVREGGERLSLGGGMAVEARRAVRTVSSPLVCMADGGAEVGGGEGTLERIRKMREAITIARGKFRPFRKALSDDEQNVKRAIIDPILWAGGWDTTKLDEVQSELPAEGRKKVDYALYSEKGRQVLIEAKALGKITPKGEKQLFEYAKEVWTPTLILTDGNVWQFYLRGNHADAPGEQGYFRVELSHDVSILKSVDVFAGCLAKGIIPGPSGILERKMLLSQRSRLEQKLGELTERERQIIGMRLGLGARLGWAGYRQGWTGDRQGWTAPLSDVAEILRSTPEGSTPEDIFKEEKAAWKKFCDDERKEEATPRARREREIRRHARR